MTTGEIAITAFLAFCASGICVLVWATYRRLESRIDRLEDRLEGRLDNQISSVRADLTQIALAVGAGRPPQAL